MVSNRCSLGEKQKVPQMNVSKRQRELISRINELAQKQKTQGLDLTEKREQAALRQQYLANFRQGLKDQIEHTVLYDKQGHEITSHKVRQIQHKHGWRPD